MANTDGKRGAKRRRKHSAKPVEQDVRPFDPGTALEMLRSAVVRLEALSNALVNSCEFWTRTNDAGGLRAHEHTYCLVMVLDTEIAKAVAMGDEMVDRLNRLLKDQR